MALEFVYTELLYYGVLTEEILALHFDLWKQHKEGLQRVTLTEFNEAVGQTTMPFGDTMRLCLQKVSRSRRFENLRSAMIESVLEGGSVGVDKQALLRKLVQKLGVTSRDIMPGHFYKIAREVAIYDPQTQRWNMKIGIPAGLAVELWLPAEERLYEDFDGEDD